MALSLFSLVNTPMDIVPEQPLDEQLWTESSYMATPMWDFMLSVNHNYNQAFKEYSELYQWSIENVGLFWEAVWAFVGVQATVPFQQTLPLDVPMYPRPDFFSGARLNFAENLIFPPNVEATGHAIVTITERVHEKRYTSWSTLREAVRKCSNALRAMGVKPHDVVAGYVSNHVEAVVAMLAAATVGAVWTSMSLDTGVSAVLDRLNQVRPKVLFADNGTVYNGKDWIGISKTRTVAAALKQSGLELVVVINNIKTELGLEALEEQGVKAMEYGAFLDTSSSAPIDFEQLPPSHPLYILFSSGTTGLPKAIVHTALGTLIQHKKEHAIHCSITSQSRMLYFTTTSWMMWHWSVSALSMGATLVLYSGSPFRPNSYMSLPYLLSEHKVTHFGTSAAYLTTLEANNVYPAREPSIDLSSLEAIYSTASPLPPSTFEYVYKAFPRRINLASITGGTDIISLFGAPCPILPVRTGQIQCAGLGMAIKAVDPITGEEVASGEPGDLVCVKPFPSQPLTFLGENGDAKYKSAYFERFENVCGVAGPVWHHGDYVRITDSQIGSLIMLGRSDGVLKPSGVRFGSAEIYNILTRFFSPEVEDAVCVGRRRPTDTDETVCLFLVMRPGKTLDDVTRSKIKTVIRNELSPRHVPGVVDECGRGVPRTSNGKKIEVAVKHILSGMDVKANASVANPESLEWFREWAKEN